MTESLIGVALTVGVIALAAVVISWLRKMRGDSWPLSEGRSPWWM